MSDTERAASLVLACTDIISEATAAKLASRIRALPSQQEGPARDSATLDELIDAIAECIVACAGRVNRDRAKAVLAVIEAQGWRLKPPKEEA